MADPSASMALPIDDEVFIAISTRAQLELEKQSAELLRARFERRAMKARQVTRNEAAPVSCFSLNEFDGSCGDGRPRT